uniref:Uncharacterized protein n=1 Tax=Tetranychus urticae TaxID=32264 RepID=T1KJC3_TETUR
MKTTYSDCPNSVRKNTGLQLI